MMGLDWLLDSDPAIRWQVLRDLVHAPAEAVAAEDRALLAFGRLAQPDMWETSTFHASFHARPNVAP